jgi:hypothetical protein
LLENIIVTNADGTPFEHSLTDIHAALAAYVELADNCDTCECSTVVAESLRYLDDPIP